MKIKTIDEFQKVDERHDFNDPLYAKIVDMNSRKLKEERRREAYRKHVAKYEHNLLNSDTLYRKEDQLEELEADLAELRERRRDLFSEQEQIVGQVGMEEYEKSGEVHRIGTELEKVENMIGKVESRLKKIRTQVDKHYSALRAINSF